MESSDSNVPDIQVNDEKSLLNKSLSSGNGSDSEEDKKKTKKVKLNPRINQERRDSGSSVGEEDDQVIEISDEQREKIVQQAEHYFSDENLKKDGFLLKHVKRNKEGYVNLKLLASFKKMKSLSRDYRVIREALKYSQKLVINDTGLKVRRVDPLPKDLVDQIKVNHIVVSKIPHDNPSMNFVTDAFPTTKEDIVSVRIVKPGKKFPNDLQSHFSRHSHLRDQIVAVVEFENTDAALKSSKTEFSEVYHGMEVKLLELGPKQIKRKENGETASDTPVDSDASPKVQRAEKNKQKSSNRLLGVTGLDDSSYGSSSDSEFSSFSSCQKRYNRSRGSSPSSSPVVERRSYDHNNNSRGNSPKASPNTSPKFNKSNRIQTTPEHRSNRNQYKLSPLVQGSPHSSPEMSRKNKIQYGDQNTEQSKSHSPWVARRLQRADESQNNLKESVTVGNHRYLDIVRQPKGPDGSVGFSNHPFSKFILVHAH